MRDEVRKGLNAQINRELQAEYLYLAMSSYFEEEDLSGFASWMRAQADEEREHALRIVDHLEERGERVEYGTLDEPRQDFGSPLAAVRAGLEHERAVTGHIHDLYELARSENDYPAQVMLEWFVEEQVEEEDTFSTLVAHLERAGESGSGLLVVDSQLAERAAAPGG